MAKILFLCLLAAVVYLLLRGRRARAAAPPAEPPPASPEAVVACAHCGVHVPLSESLTAEGGRYCCEEHLRLGPHDSRHP